MLLKCAAAVNENMTARPTRVAADQSRSGATRSWPASRARSVTTTKPISGAGCSGVAWVGRPAGNSTSANAPSGESAADGGAVPLANAMSGTTRLAAGTLVFRTSDELLAEFAQHFKSVRVFDVKLNAHIGDWYFSSGIGGVLLVSHHDQAID
jgi:hypothetical protein